MTNDAAVGGFAGFGLSMRRWTQITHNSQANQIAATRSSHSTAKTDLLHFTEPSSMPVQLWRILLIAGFFCDCAENNPEPDRDILQEWLIHWSLKIATRPCGSVRPSVTRVESVV